MKVQRILVPVDYSPCSVRAVEHAVWLAGQLGANVTVVHVAPEPVDYLPLDRWIWGEEQDEHQLRDKVQKGARKKLDDFLGELSSETRDKLETRLETGVPWKVITKLLDEEGYDMAVMGTHGHTGAEHVFLGSTTERVLRHATRPVLGVH